MDAIRVIRFDHGKTRYEVRVVWDGATVYVRAFHGGRPANGYSYRADLSTTIPDLKQATGLDGIKKMIDAAKDDVTSGRWEKLQRLLKKQK
jgi:hypothetical protein